MFLHVRQSSLIFNDPGKKIPTLLTASEQEFQEIKLPASHGVRRLLTSQHILKCEMTHIASQRITFASERWRTLRASQQGFNINSNK